MLSTLEHEGHHGDECGDAGLSDTMDVDDWEHVQEEDVRVTEKVEEESGMYFCRIHLGSLPSLNTMNRP